MNEQEVTTAEIDRLYEKLDKEAEAAGYYHTMGLRADGTMVAVGDNEYRQCNITSWTLSMLTLSLYEP